jgi:alcohol-forming fatty acyl-CoA reductase
MGVAARLEEEVLASTCFDRLRERHGAGWQAFHRSKLETVDGDLTRDRLGLSEAVWIDLAGRLDILINSAATVTFDERLDNAIELNALGLARLLELARAAREKDRDPLFVQVSTCYVSGRRTGPIDEVILERPNRPVDSSSLRAEIENLRGIVTSVRIRSRHPSQVERFLRRARRVVPPHAGSDRLADLARRAREGWLTIMGRGEPPPTMKGRLAPDCSLTPTLSHKGRGRVGAPPARTFIVRTELIAAGMEHAQAEGYHDTYTYTKSLGERLLCAERSTIRTAIVRPAIIESALAEPTPGWLDGLRMADPLIVTYGRGNSPSFRPTPRSYSM